LFDIWKPWPISWLDKNMSGGLGIMIDDIVAGLTAGGLGWLLQAYVIGNL
ncbi:phosphatidylglycerophosphatase A, partial [Porticoccaceae bacterium]|nr:phosphatidylglycerophosphatase A [Porticoccaceae bacterium]